MFKNVVFDLDGTLLDTSEGIIESVSYTIDRLGFDKLPYEKLLTFVGPPIQNSFITHYGCDKIVAQKAANIFREYYKTEALLKAKAYDGIYDLCKELKAGNIKMAAATYKREDYALKLLCYFGFDKFFSSMHGADNNNVLKKEDIILLCLDELGAQKNESVLVGDTDNDAIGAQKADVPFIAVTYGFGFKEQGELDKYPIVGVAKTPMDILSIIN